MDEPLGYPKPPKREKKPPKPLKRSRPRPRSMKPKKVEGRKFRQAQMQAAFERDGRACRRCGRKEWQAVLDVHHIKFRSQGGGDEDENLVTLCRESGCEAHDEAHGLRDQKLYIRHDPATGGFEFSYTPFD